MSTSGYELQDGYSINI